MPILKKYHQIVDQLMTDIKNGVLRPGDQLPPQREFAYQNNIAPSTASRVYKELVKRGAAIGEVGRGTFIRTFNHSTPILGEPTTEPINLQLNFSTLQGQAAKMISGLAPLLRPDILENTIQPVGVQADYVSRENTANLLRQTSWVPNSDQILFTGGGRQGIAAAMSSVASIGDRIGVEQLTYPIIKGIAARLGINLVPIRMDEDGICIDALISEHNNSPLKAIYIQPSLHNPLGTTMGLKRQEALAEYIKANDIFVIEDGVYSFLANEKPFASLAKDHTLYVDSLSKRVAAGFGFGFIICPPHLKEKCIASIRTGGWSASNISFYACQRWISDGVVESISELKRKDAAKRQLIAKDILKDFVIYADPRSYHLWMEIPNTWRAEAFSSAASARGVAVSPASIFSVEPGSAPNAIRLALAPPSIDELARGLNIIKNLATISEVEIE